MSLRTHAMPWILAGSALIAGWRPTVPVPGKPTQQSLEGVYRLTKRVIDGRDEQRASRGYLAVTSRHMLLCVTGPGADPDLPLLRSGVRTWRLEDDLVRSEVQFGYFTDADGGVHLERAGMPETRRVEQARGLLRVYQGARSYLEFERVE